MNLMVIVVMMVIVIVMMILTISTVPGPGLDELDFVTTVRHLMIVVMIF